MFERFTDRARQAVVLGQEEVRRLRHDHVGTEHVLLGLLAESEGVAAQALVASGVTLEAAREQVERIVPAGAAETPGHIPFTRNAKRALEYALREALQLGHGWIGTEHLLLGMIRIVDARGTATLTALGVDLDALREEVLRRAPGSDPPRSRQPSIPRIQSSPVRVDERLSSIERKLDELGQQVAEVLRKLDER